MLSGPLQRDLQAMADAPGPSADVCRRAIARIEALEDAIKPFALMADRFYDQREVGEDENAIKRSDFERACETLIGGDK